MTRTSLRFANATAHIDKWRLSGLIRSCPGLALEGHESPSFTEVTDNGYNEVDKRHGTLQAHSFIRS